MQSIRVQSVTPSWGTVIPSGSSSESESASVSEVSEVEQKLIELLAGRTPEELSYTEKVSLLIDSGYKFGPKEEKFIELLAGRDPEKLSETEKVFLAIDMGETSEDEELSDIKFAFPPEQERTIPDYLILNNCSLLSGTLRYTRGNVHAATDKAIPIANGPAAHSYANEKGFRAYSENGGTAHSSQGGTAVASKLGRVDIGNLGKGEAVIANKEDFKATFNGVFSYNDRLSLCDNIFALIDKEETFYWFSKITFSNINFTVPSRTTRVLPTSIHLDGCHVFGGNLDFSHGKLKAATDKAIPVANGPDAHSYAKGQNRKSYSINGGNAHSSDGAISIARDQSAASAKGGGIAVAKGHSSTASATGKSSIACGLHPESTVKIDKKATLYAISSSIKIEGSYYKESTQLHGKESPVETYTDNGELELTSQSRKYLTTLFALVKAGDAEAAMELGKIKNEVLKLVDSLHENPQVYFLTKAHKLGNKKAAYRLGEYHMKQGMDASKLDLVSARSWYEKALKDQHCSQSLREKIELRLSQINALL